MGRCTRWTARCARLWSASNPKIRKVRLVDYKVRVLNADAATAAKVRVLIQSTDGTRTWGTVGVSENVVEASWQALVDSLEYVLLRERVGALP